MMEETSDSGILKELSGNKANGPEGIGIAEDSGFASIAGSVADVPAKEDPDVSFITQDVKFRAINIEEMDLPTKKKRKIDLEEIEARKKAEEEFNNRKREQIYKRLMHLLSKSKFYSKYIIDKINMPVVNNDKVKTKRTKKKVKKPTKEVKETDENAAPSKRSRRNNRVNDRYDIREYVSADMKKTLDEQKKKMDLSQEEIEAELNSQSDSDEKNGENEAAAPVVFVNPTYFKGELRDYQIEGLQWLKLLYENGVNGILADEMGLGKTIQVIALFCHLLEKRQDGPYLIIAPLSTIPNWLIEFERFAPKLPVVLYHGTPQVRDVALLKMKKKYPVTNNYSTYPIIITTYDYPIRARATLAKFQWRYIVIDEGHRIKNYECQLVGSLKKYTAMNRLLLTGTPLQNNLSELWSLLNFLLPEIFNDLAVFESWFDAKELQETEGMQKVLKQEEEKQVLSTLREILKPFMLRRVKSDVCLDIPPRKEIIVYAPLTELQHNLYKAVLRHDLEVLSKINKEDAFFFENQSNLKRRCVTRYRLTENSGKIPKLSNSDSYARSVLPDEEDESFQRAQATRTENESINDSTATPHLNMWKKYTQIDDRNREFFVRIRFGTRLNLYKQIVNHPYLIHCPLDDNNYPQINDDLIKASGKLLVLDAMLKKLNAQGHKVLLFTTLTLIIDVIADYLTLRPWRFLILDGRQSIDERQENIKEFNNNPDVFIFLISTRAGGVGLNLAAADTVIIYDSDWNPQCDIQAMARCHRIGQTRPVVVYRMCTKGTIDERIINRAQAKRKLEKMVISKETKLDLKDSNTLVELKRLLDSTESTIVTAEKEVYTEAELDKILDRSDLIWPSSGETAASTEESDSA